MKGLVPKIDIDRALVEAIALHPARLASIERQVAAFDKEHRDNRLKHRKWQKGLQKDYAAKLNDRPKFLFTSWLLLPAHLFRWVKWSVAFTLARRRVRRCRMPRDSWEPAYITQMRLVHQFYLANRAVVMENEFDRSLDIDAHVYILLGKQDLARYDHELTRFRNAAHEMDIRQLRVI